MGYVSFDPGIFFVGMCMVVTVWYVWRPVGRVEGRVSVVVSSSGGKKGGGLYGVVFRRGGSGRCGECCRRSMIVVVVLLLQDVLPALLCVDPHASLD